MKPEYTFILYASGAVIVYTYTAIMGHRYREQDDPQPWAAGLVAGLLWPVILLFWIIDGGR